MIRPTGISHIAMVTSDLDRYRSFYEGVIGLDTELVLGPEADHGRHAILMAGCAVIHVFEVDGYDPAAHGVGTGMFERGRLDHLGFTVADEAELRAVGARLVAAAASDGEVQPLGPVLSVRYRDPDGFEGEINCFNDAFVPPPANGQDEIVDSEWLDSTRRVLAGER